MDVKQICANIDITEIIEKEISGFEGMLETDENKSRGRIFLNSKSKHTRKRFTLAHEVGHYVNPNHTPISSNIFKCTEQDLRIEQNILNDLRIKMEIEANQFAAELLMPSERLSKYTNSSLIPDIEHIIEVSHRLDVSREASARRYVEIASVPMAVIFSQNGEIRYFKKNSGFSWLSVNSGQQIPKESLTAKFYGDVRDISGIEEVAAHIWLEKSADISLGEQTLNQMNGYQMTLLSAEISENESEWETPSF